jgi:GDP-4-dehydro-6-deoxy-D-mannose reductase
MRSVLITGAGGFVGRRVATLLQDGGARVATVGRSEGGGPLHFAFGPAPWTCEQWQTALDASEPDIIFHLAGTTHGAANDFEAVNVGLAEGLFSALRRLGAQPDLLLAGSAAEYGDAIVDGAAVEEDLLCQPRGEYGRSKLAQTMSALAFGEETGAKVLVARLFNPIGSGMPPNLALSDFARQISGPDHVLTTGNLDVSRDFMDVSSTAAALVALAKRPGARGVVNVCSGAATNLRRIVERLLLCSGKMMRIVVDPARLRPGEPRIIIGSTAKLASLGVASPGLDIDRVAVALLADAQMRARM